MTRLAAVIILDVIGITLLAIAFRVAHRAHNLPPAEHGRAAMHRRSAGFALAAALFCLTGFLTGLLGGIR